ncbi:MAG: tetratricopeptide repeat protein, partial [Burkholderiaceae bacterium]|nr:tetratricopeptide repeat protein [Burkholderiaceae bacterium]
RVAVRRALWLALGGALIALTIAAWFASRPPAPASLPSASAPAAAPEFVGSAACAQCHRAESAAWQGSQHARAMQHATPETVLGDFNGSRHTFQGVTSTFFKRDGKFVVRTDGPDGRLTDFEVRYTFGVAPLQQYLVELPGGRLQALSVGWDARPKEAGGQRWFRQYPGESIDHRDELHWTRRSQNWNVMCADCHSTDVRKNHDAASDSFATRYAEIAVGCEACHGPGSAHLEWAKTKPVADARKGLTVALDERRGVNWQIDAVTGNARRSAERRSSRELDVCAQCHARRAQIAEGYRAGQPFMDHYLPARLTDGLYHADGQQRDEVFTWGSFLQSRMHAAGVTCSDCHDPHTQALRAPGNAVCSQCHAASKYDGKQHHFHAPDSPGARCVDCHMPATTYMVVDPRRDHSFRVPRPDLAARLGTPDACSGCHAGKKAPWAAAVVARWYGPQHAKPGAASALLGLAGDARQPAIVRATAIELLARYPGARTDEMVRRALADADPMVRHAAVAALQSAPPQAAAAALAPLLEDRLRTVRLEAARVLAQASAPPPAAAAAAFERALREYEATQRANLSAPEAWLNLGNLYVAQRDAERAEAAYREALKRDPQFVPAYVNLADLYRLGQRDAEGEALLRDGLRAVPTAPGLREALGLALVRRGDKRAALDEFASAYRAATAQPRFAYLYALALDDAGRRPEALRVLSDSGRRGASRDVLLALASLRAQSGDAAGAQAALQTLAAINPDDPALAQHGARR